MARRCFYSFQYRPDCWRAAQVRNIRAIEGNQPATDNDWETVTRGGDPAIERWISGQMHGRTCCIVLVGAETAGRKWITHEIIKAWNDGLGVAGIRIHGLLNQHRQLSVAGGNPFDHVWLNQGTRRLSTVVPLYDPPGFDSPARYDWISRSLSGIVETAIGIRVAN